jgi:epoxyqueuosine reductase
MIGPLVVMFVRMFAWNKFSKPHNQPLFNPNPELLSMSKSWIEKTEETFKTVFKDSPLKEPSLRALEGMSILLSKRD